MTTTETPTETPNVEPPAPAIPETDLQAELDKWKSLARENEKRAKANSQAAKDLEEFRKSQMSETDKAVAEAELRGRKAALADAAQRIAAAEIRGALTGLVDDPTSIVDDLNLSKFITDDGDIDSKAVAALKAKFAGFAPRVGSIDQGARPTSGNTPLNGDPLLSSLKSKLGIG